MSTEPVAECEACGYKTVLMTYPRSAVSPNEPRQTKRLCRLCANTLTGRLEDGYSHTHSIREHDHVLRTICYVGNAIIECLALSLATSETMQEAMRRGIVPPQSE
jgi:hypothetical protein